MASFGIGLIAVVLGIAFEKQNVIAFMAAGLGIAAASSSAVPVDVLKG
jgi:cation/acetate symporter